MTQMIALPILIPLLAAAACLLAWSRRPAQRWLSVAGAAGLLGVGLALLATADREGILVSQMGNWPAPYGITLVVDRFSAVMIVMAGAVGLAVAVYSLAAIDPDREAYGFHPLLHVLLMGVCGAFLTGDLFNLYVWFEVMLMASFVLLVLGGEPGQLQGGIKYVTLNLVSSAVFLAAVGILYGVAGTLNMADLARKLEASTNPGLVTTAGTLFLIAFGVKAAVFPLFFWLPGSYHTPPVVVSALFAGLLTKVGVYALIRVFTLIFTREPGYTHGLIVLIAALTMLTGVLGAVAQSDFRRVLSFHIISQIGYMIFGLGLAGLAQSRALATLALAGAVFYVVHHIVVKTNLFLVCGVVGRLRGTYELKNLGSLYRTNPGLTLLFAIPAFSLSGVPPLSGFFAKLSLVKAGLGVGEYAAVAVALATGLLTLYSMTKIWVEAFWKESPGPVGGVAGGGRAPASMIGPIAALAVTTVAFGLFAGPVFEFSARTAEQLLDADGYTRAVLGDWE
jgi:multicomponent Na+:H+ antiporter subunit D